MHSEVCQKLRTCGLLHTQTTANLSAQQLLELFATLISKYDSQLSFDATSFTNMSHAKLKSSMRRMEIGHRVPSQSAISHHHTSSITQSLAAIIHCIERKFGRNIFSSRIHNAEEEVTFDDSLLNPFAVKSSIARTPNIDSKQKALRPQLTIETTENTAVEERVKKVESIPESTNALSTPQKCEDSREACCNDKQQLLFDNIIDSSNAFVSRSKLARTPLRQLHTSEIVDKKESYAETPRKSIQDSDTIPIHLPGEKLARTPMNNNSFSSYRAVDVDSNELSYRNDIDENHNDFRQDNINHCVNDTSTHIFSPVPQAVRLRGEKLARTPLSLSLSKSFQHHTLKHNTESSRGNDDAISLPISSEPCEFENNDKKVSKPSNVDEKNAKQLCTQTTAIEKRAEKHSSEDVCVAEYSDNVRTAERIISRSAATKYEQTEKHQRTQSKEASSDTLHTHFNNALHLHTPRSHTLTQLQTKHRESHLEQQRIITHAQLHTDTSSTSSAQTSTAKTSSLTQAQQDVQRKLNRVTDYVSRWRTLQASRKHLEGW